MCLCTFCGFHLCSSFLSFNILSIILLCSSLILFRKVGEYMDCVIDRFSVDELKDIVSHSYSFKEVLRKLGYKTLNGRNNDTLRKRLNRYNIDISHFGVQKQIHRTKENVFCKNSTATQAVLRRWYQNISDDTVCGICGQSKQWNGKLLTMILDHLNGDHHDNRIENLRWICPNCNSQLSTFAGRNSKIHN